MNCVETQVHNESLRDLTDLKIQYFTEKPQLKHQSNVLISSRTAKIDTIDSSTRKIFRND